MRTAYNTLTLVLVTFLLTLPATGATKNWTGSGGDVKWSTAGNWDTSVPTSTDAVIIPGASTGDPDIDNGAASCASILIGSGKTLTFNTSGGKLTVSGTVETYGGGTISFGSVSSATLEIGGDLVNGGTFTAGNGTVIMNGSGDQGINSPTTFNTLEINKTGGNVYLGASITINNSLTFTAGNLYLGAYTLTLGGTVSSAAATHCVVTDGTGVVSCSIAAGNFTFPIGHDATHYNPVNIANAGSAQTYSACVTAGTNPLGDANTANTCGRTWTLAGGGTANIAFTWNTADAGSALQGDVSDATAWSNGGSGWVQQGGTTTAGTPNVTTVTGITTFSSWLVGTKGALPIQIASFAANVVRNNQVEVAWRTVSETNNYGFDIYRKRGDAGEWAKIAFVQGHGTTLTPFSYSYVDGTLTFGKYYYQIKQIDLNGKSETFPEMSVTVGVGPDKFVLAQNYPNPFNPSTVIEFVVPQSGFATMKVYNILGQEVTTLFEGNADASRVYTARFNGSNLPSGLYFYTLKSASNVQTRHMMLVK
jgi:hypothetical protein